MSPGARLKKLRISRGAVPCPSEWLGGPSLWGAPPPPPFLKDCDVPLAQPPTASVGSQMLSNRFATTRSQTICPVAVATFVTAPQTPFLYPFCSAQTCSRVKNPPQDPTRILDSKRGLTNPIPSHRRFFEHPKPQIAFGPITHCNHSHRTSAYSFQDMQFWSCICVVPS